MTIGMEDHVIATAIVYIGEQGKLPPAMATVAEALAAFRGCDVEDAQDLVDEQAVPAETLRHLVNLRGAVPRGMQLDFEALIVAITGWDEQRAALALRVAAQAGLVGEQMGVVS